MQSFDTSLLVFETTSMTSGLRAHEAIASTAGVRIIEATPIGSGGFMLLISGEADVLKAAAAAARDRIGAEGIADEELIEKADRSVLEAAFSLAQIPLGESLIAVETETISGMFDVAHVLLSTQGAKPIEIKIRRSSKGAYAYFTSNAKSGGLAATEAESRLRLGMRKGDVEFIETPSAALRSKFEIIHTS